MRIMLHRREAAEIVSGLLPLTQNKQLMALNHILITAEGNTITLTADNLETRASITVSGDVEQSGECLIPAKQFADILRTYPHEKIMLSEDVEGNGRMAVIGQQSPAYQIATLQPDTFPDRKSPDALSGAAPVIISAGYLLEALAVNNGIRPVNDEKRVYTMGALLSVTDNRIDVISTDSKRLIRYSTPVQPCADLPPLLVHKGAAAAIIKMLPEGWSDVTLRTAGNALHLAADGMEIHATLLEGGFPRITETLDAARTTPAFVLDGELLAGVLKRALVMVEADHPHCILEFTANASGFAGGSVSVTVGNIDMGTFSETIPVAWEREDLEIALNPKYLLDAVGACTTDKIEVRVNGNAHPVMIRDLDDGPVECVVMPVRI